MRAAVFQPGWRAVGHNWRPFVLIQAVAIGLACLYYASPDFQSWAAALAAFKVKGGYPFSFLANALAGAILPELAKRATMRSKPTAAAEMAFQLVFFGLLGVYIDWLYRTQALVFGDTLAVGVVVAKVLVDMFVSSPLVTIPSSAAAFQWKDEGFSLARTLRRFRQGAFAERYWPLLITCWAFWIPVVTAVYSMPRDLQFCLFLCAQAAWSLLLLHMSGRE
jgi:hypothetical protein